MATRLFLLCILCTIGFKPSSLTELNTSLVLVREPPSITWASKDRAVVLNCEAVPRPVQVRWTHNNVLLDLPRSDASADGVSGDKRRTLMPDGSLFIKRLIHRPNISSTALSYPIDSGAVATKNGSQTPMSFLGVYQCNVSNKDGSLLSRPTKVQFGVLASNFSEHPVDTSVMVGDAARLSCSIESLPETNILWEKNRKRLPNDTMRHVTLPEGVLLIANTQSKDAGSYRCVIYNPTVKETRYSAEASLTVLLATPTFRPPVMLTPKDRPKVKQIKIIQGQSKGLDCAASGNPVPTVVWTAVLPGQTKAQEASAPRLGVNVLDLHSIETRFEALYTCLAVNHEEEGGPEFTAKQVYNVTVLVAPYVSGKPKFQINTTPRTVRLECGIIGIPTPVITWYKDGQLLHINGRIKQKGFLLVLSNSMTTDSGYYQCRGVNEVGEVWEATRLLINASQSLPSPPTAVRCSIDSSSSINITWDNVPGHFAYSIHYVLTDGGEELQEVTRNNSYRVENLRSYTNYTFYVRVYKGKLASDGSEHIVCRTGDGIPSTVPVVHLQPLGPTSVRVSWSLLRPEEARGQITEHRIVWRRHGNLSVHMEEVNEDVLEYTISGLIPGRLYDVHVLSATARGWPYLSKEQIPWYTVEMPLVGPSNVPLPPEVHLTVVNATSIEVTWSMPLKNKVKPSGYRLSYRRQTDPLVGPLPLEETQHQFLLTGLDAQTQYEVQVQAIGAGDIVGGTASKSIHTLGSDEGIIGGLVEPPSGLEAEPLSPSSIRLNWQAPSIGSDAVSFYTVRYHPVQSNPSVNGSTYVRSTSLGVEVVDLKPFTVYEFQVRSHDESSRPGPYSDKVECQTKEDVPDPPRNVQMKVINQTTVKVSWNEPLQINGLLGAYKVYYTQEPDKPIDQWSQLYTNLSYAEISGLFANSRYELCVQASTQAGHGKSSAPLLFTIPTLSPGVIYQPGANVTSVDLVKSESSSFWWIIISAFIIVIAVTTTIAITYCVRHVKNGNHRHEMSQRGNSSGRAVHSNGNGVYGASPHASTTAQQITLDHEDLHEEIELMTQRHFTGSSTNIPPAETSTMHLDTKGGYPNSHINGTRVPLLGNGPVPNGHLSKPYHSSRGDNQLRITENPQFQQQPLPHLEQAPLKCNTCGASLSSACRCNQEQQQQPLLSSRDDHSLADTAEGEEDEEEEEPSWANGTQITTVSEIGDSDRRHRTTSNGSHHRGNGQTQCA